MKIIENGDIVSGYKSYICRLDQFKPYNEAHARILEFLKAKGRNFKAYALLDIYALGIGMVNSDYKLITLYYEKEENRVRYYVTELAKIERE